VLTTFSQHSGVCRSRTRDRRCPAETRSSRRTTGICVELADATVHSIGSRTSPRSGQRRVNRKRRPRGQLVGLQRRPNKPGCATEVPMTARVDRWLKLAPSAHDRWRPARRPRSPSGWSFCDRRSRHDVPVRPRSLSHHDRLGLTAERGAGWWRATTTFTAPSEAGIYTVTATLDEGSASVTLNAPVATSRANDRRNARAS